MSQQSGQTYRRPRRGRPRCAACETCRAKKVKCDERTPICTRCDRLQLPCHWPRESSHASALGPTLDGTSLVHQFVPSGGLQEHYPLSPRTIASLCPRLPNKSHGGSGIPMGEYYVGDMAHLTPGSDTSLVSSLGEIWNFDFTSNFLEDVTGQESIINDSLFSNRTDDVNRSRPGSKGNYSYQTISQGTIPRLITGDSLLLNTCLEINEGDQRALDHYQHWYIRRRVVKAPEWSTYGCILRVASQKPIILHLLIAVSALEMSHLDSIPSEQMQVSKNHFRSGADMLVKGIDSSNRYGPADILLALFLIYNHMTGRERIDPYAIDRLSATALAHIAHVMPTRDSSTFTSVDSVSPVADPDHSLVCRIIILLCWNDAVAAFQGFGGHVAGLLCTRPDEIRYVFAQQVNTLATFWGNQYPAQEMAHDLQHVAIMEFGNETMCLLQAVNQLSYQCPSKDGTAGNELQQKITDLGTVSLTSL
ncbi:hypothetical protein E8E14_007262 [Neopestalotiopsis sp. 37M]|nr:hypothetical protein E8E14_007262 [Neopestalotiopsis sp. 37M]